jgi:hypothetical protein
MDEPDQDEPIDELTNSPNASEDERDEIFRCWMNTTMPSFAGEQIADEIVAFFLLLH